MRNKALKYSLYAVIPLLFNGLFFLLGGTDHHASVWIAYAWIHIAYLLLIATPLLSRKTQSVATFQLTIGLISGIYFLVELIIGVIVIFIDSEKIKGSIVAQMIPFCVYLFFAIINLMANEHTANSEGKRGVEIMFIKSASSRAKYIMDSVSEQPLKSHIEKIYDLIHASPTKSNPMVKEYEGRILVLLDDLSQSITDKDYEGAEAVLSRIRSSMEERNRLVSLAN